MRLEPQTDTFTQTVQDLCWQIDDLKAALRRAEQEAREWREKYAELQSSSIEHGHAMMGHVLHAALKGAFNGPRD